ncbi:MAG: EF-hand domain-containing protein [Chthoniobacteraceae bacterium]
MNHALRLRSTVATAFLALAFGGNLNAIEIPGAGALADLVIARFDSNGDSKIDSGEWQLGAAASFEEIDVDRDGKITATEIDALGEPIGKEAGAAAGALVPQLIKPLILSMDADADGAVSREEFTKKMGALFAILDANKDAQVMREEMIELPVKTLVPGPK